MRASGLRSAQPRRRNWDTCLTYRPERHHTRRILSGTARLGQWLPRPGSGLLCSSSPEAMGDAEHSQATQHQTDGSGFGSCHHADIV